MGHWYFRVAFFQGHKLLFVAGPQALCVSGHRPALCLTKNNFPGIFGINLFLNIFYTDAFILQEEFMNIFFSSRSSEGLQQPGTLRLRFLCWLYVPYSQIFLITRQEKSLPILLYQGDGLFTGLLSSEIKQKERKKG